MIKVRHAYTKGLTTRGTPKHYAEYVGFGVIDGGRSNEFEKEFNYPTYWVTLPMKGHISVYKEFEAYVEANPTMFTAQASFRNSGAGNLLTVYRKEPTVNGTSKASRVFGGLPGIRLCNCCGIWVNSVVSLFSGAVVVVEGKLIIEKLSKLPDDLVALLPHITSHYWEDNGFAFFTFKSEVAKLAAVKNFDRYWGTQGANGGAYDYCMTELREWVNANSSTS